VEVTAFVRAPWRVDAPWPEGVLHAAHVQGGSVLLLRCNLSELEALLGDLGLRALGVRVTLEVDYQPRSASFTASSWTERPTMGSPRFLETSPTRLGSS
jgi:hypothetical protein